MNCRRQMMLGRRSRTSRTLSSQRLRVRSVLNKKFCARWSEALRSGKYRQGTHRLRNADDTYCCLGVACDLLAEDGILPPWVIGDGDEFYHIDGSNAGLPQAAMNFIGLDPDNSLGCFPS